MRLHARVKKETIDCFVSSLISAPEFLRPIPWDGGSIAFSKKCLNVANKKGYETNPFQIQQFYQLVRRK
jgi:hypothetical protein